MIHGEVDIRTDCSLKNIIRACFTIDTQGPKTNKVPNCFETLDGNSSLWYTNYRQEFGAGLLDKGGLTNIISHAVNEYHVSVHNYMTYGLRDHYVQLVKSQYDLPNHIAEIISLRILMTFEKTNKGQFSFKLSSDDNFLSKKVRRKETKDLIRVRVEEEQRKIPKITSSFSSLFQFLHHIYTRLDYLNTHKNKKNQVLFGSSFDEYDSIFHNN